MQNTTLSVQSNNPAAAAIFQVMAQVITFTNFVTAQGEASRQRVATAYTAQHEAIAPWFPSDDDQPTTAHTITAIALTSLLAIATVVNYLACHGINLYRQYRPAQPQAATDAPQLAAVATEPQPSYWATLWAFLVMLYGYANAWVQSYNQGDA